MITYWKKKGSSQKIPRIKKYNPLFGVSVFLLVVSFMSWGIYFFIAQPAGPEPTKILEQPESHLTMEQRIKIRANKISIQQGIKAQDAKVEQLREPVTNVRAVEPKLSGMDMGVHIPDNTMKAVVKDIQEDPLDNNIYQSPENIIFQKMAQRDWLKDHLQDKDEQEKQEFIKDFIELAREQGYEATVFEDMKVVLRPLGSGRLPKNIKPENLRKMPTNW